MSLVLLGTVFGIIFLGELPDKTMFASLVLASRGRAGLVWLGAAGAFLLHVAIAVTVGGVLLNFLPHRLVDGIVAIMFLVGAIMAFRDNGEDADDAGTPARTGSRAGSRTALTAFVVIFIAEWGDLTQILTANLAAKYQAPIQVGLAAVLALWVVAAIAMVAGRLLRNLPIVPLRRVTGVVLLVLGVLAVLDAIAGVNTIT